MRPAELAVLGAAAAAAGAINSIAGGGSLISFPIAVALGMPPLVANATNSVALAPGSIASAWAYRREVAQDRGILRLLLPPAIGGSLAGALILLHTPQRLFDAIVPFLVLFATLLLLAQSLRKRPAGDDPDAAWTAPKSARTAVALELLVGIYGGYFGAGMGIMMLALLALLGGRNLHRMNGVKSVLGGAINVVAALAFVGAGAIDFAVAGVMAAGAVAGGLLGAAGARRVNPRLVQWGVIAIGLALSAVLAHQRYAAYRAG